MKSKYDTQGEYLVLEVNSVPAWRGLQTVCPTDISNLLVKDMIYGQSINSEPRTVQI